MSDETDNSGDWQQEAQRSPDDFFFDGEGVGEGDLGGGEMVEKEGWYHLEITGTKNEFATTNKKGAESSPFVRLDMQVLESVDGQSPAGSRYFHKIYVGGKGGAAPPEGSRNSALRFGVGIGLLEVVGEGENQKVVIKGTQETRIPASIWQKAVGMQCCAKIAKERQSEEDVKKGYNAKYAIPFGRAYRPDDPTVADVPKNAEALKNAGITAPLGKKSVDKTQAAGSARNEGKSTGGKKSGGEAPPPKGNTSSDPLADL